MMLQTLNSAVQVSYLNDEKDDSIFIVMFTAVDRFVDSSLVSVLCLLSTGFIQRVSSSHDIRALSQN